MMLFPWRRNRGGGRRRDFGSKGGMEITIPQHFICPITLDLMRDPVTLCTGVTYDRESIERWIESGNVNCPVTNQVATNSYPIPNHVIRKMIQNWCVENKSHGFERIPTPRVPVTPHEISEVRLKMAAAAQDGDGRKLGELVLKVRNWGMESERNKRCILGNGVGSVLAYSFNSFAGVSGNADLGLLKEILSLLTWPFSFSSKDVSHLKSSVSLRFIAGFLKEDDLSAKQNAICFLKHLVSVDDKILLEIEGIEETLVNILKLPISSQSTINSLVIIHHILSSSSSQKTATAFIESGLIASLLEILVDGDTFVCDKGLSILDKILSWEEGKASVCQNELAVPLLVKKISRVSDAATEMCVSCIWKMSSVDDALDEAVRLGLFQKLLVVLQIGCDERTKEKSKELLKTMNLLYGDDLDCFEPSMALQYVKR